MIYSKWQPDTGRYDYYESNERHPLGEDLPTPRLPMGTAIGVPSTEAGRALPLHARRVGSGAEARGVVTPMNRSGTLGLGLFALPFGVRDVGLIALGAVSLWAYQKWGPKL